MPSEVATLQFLNKAKVPSRRYSIIFYVHGETPVGARYTLMGKLQGKSLRWSPASPEQRTKILPLGPYSNPRDYLRTSIEINLDFDDGQFYMRHAHGQGDHILIDVDYKHHRIVDWEWAYTEPKSAAFKSNIILLSVADFCNGANCIGEEESTFATN
ncbi:hypothetical protein BDV38DRAFT_276502 [Aspergillus pseudotamarii]|uniref:Uncharacterized protein n=1 Tax=Aspergillus pseudotamarii TaxID=132259 RepID=A0A5N6S839_ASPPS|nr:uncharacterized protein BDV38DRAFT_276502 [Aspergillus pseudotamarii]KAE8130782.1 hypothetical protein BDV38DRAFT_276502 [Aspergillus pseudotamarii]